MIDSPFFRALGSLAAVPALGPELKAILLNERGGTLRKPARAIVEQANIEAKALGIAYLYAALSDKPFDEEVVLPYSPDFQLKGTVACKQDETGIWQGDDSKLINRRVIGPCLGVFVGPIENKSVVACYQEFIADVFPSETVSSPDLSLVAGAALRLIVPNLKSVPLEQDQLINLPNAELLKTVMEVLKAAYISFGNATSSWNVMWMLHVDAGLSTLEDAITTFVGEDLEAFISDIIYPCFALPNPEDSPTGTYRAGHVLAKAIRDHWSTSDEIAVSIERINLHRASGKVDPLLLSSIDWSDFDTTVNRRLKGGGGSSLLGWIFHLSSTSEPWKALGDVTEEEFFMPSAGALQMFEFLDADSRPLSTRGLLGNVEILGPTTLASRAAGRRVETLPLIVLLPVSNILASPTEVSISNVVLHDLSPRGKGRVEVDVVRRSLWTDGRVALHVVLHTSVTKTGEYSFIPQVRTLKLQIPPGDSLNRVILRDAQARVLLLPTDGVGALVTGIKKGKQLSVIGQGKFDASGSVLDEENDISIEADPDTELEVFVWSVRSPYSLTLNGKDQIINHNSVVRLQKKIQMPSTSLIFQVDDVQLSIEPTEVDGPDDTPGLHYSPLKAATEKGNISLLVRQNESEDLRARVETLIVENWADWCLAGKNIGHIAVSSERGEDLSSVHLDDVTRVLVSPEIIGPNNVWPVNDADKVDAELLNSDELTQFLQAFDELQLFQGIDSIVSRGGPSWISKLEIPLHLRETVGPAEDWRLPLDRYLTAYVELVRKADQCSTNSFGRFWARFPFTVSIWNQSPKLLAAVMLSPFHPLRLSWIANAEDALRTSNAAVEIRRMFAGTISGWQFPLITRSNREQGSLMAVPTDGGVDSLFAGWSMLVRVSVDALTPLSVPKSAADSDVPGVSANGLDSSALESAIDDFCKANPFVSTLVVDLAASSPSPRTTQLDLGLIAKVRSWTDSRSQSGHSPGGIRIYDSINRLGEIPIEASGILDATIGDAPSLTWRKYDPATFVPQANIRVMNDSGVDVEVQVSDRRYGVVSGSPLRRFEVTHVVEGQPSSESNPSVNPRPESPFVEALVALESINALDLAASSKVQLSLRAGNALLSGAEWTVVGESGLAPASLTALLQRAGNRFSRSTLWEWRPPFFDGGHDSVLSTVDRRPYLTVAQVPKIYSQKLRGLVSRLLSQNATEQEVSAKIDRVLETLGSRGVGLSSLINGNQRHRTHQKGALGFSMVFDLIDNANSVDNVRFLIPIDAANQYLNVLAGRRRREGGPRADLLAIELRDNQLVLVPIEIKFYSLDSPVAILPDLTDAGVLDALTQSRASCDLLADVKSFWEESRNEPGTRQLMDNALTALIDAAVRLTPLSKTLLDSVYRRMQSLADGDLQIVVGAPVVSYLVATRDSLTSRRASTMAPFHAEVFIADPRTVETDLRSGVDTKALREWREVIESAFKTSQRDIPPAPPAGDLGGSQAGGPISPPAPPAGDSSVIPVDIPMIPNESDSTTNTLPDAEEGDSSDEVDAPVEGDAHATSGHIEPELVNEDLEVGEADSPGSGRTEAVPQVASSDQSTNSIVSPGVKIRIGELLENESQEMWVWPGNTDLNSLNIGVLGDMGTGKTQLCLGLVNQFRRSSRLTQPNTVSGLILDYKHDYQKPEFLAAVGGRVLLPRNLPLDLFGVSGEKSMFAMNNKALNFIGIISLIFGGIGAQQRERLRGVIIDRISALPHSPTMRDISEAYQISANNKPDSVTEILNNFVYGEVFTANHEEFQTLSELLSDNVVIVDLQANELDERTKKTLVAVFLSKYSEYMVGLPKWPVQPGDPQLRRINSLLLVDEAVSIMEYDFEPLHKILLQGREYGVAVILSSQYLSHFMTSESNYAQPLRTWFIHRIPTVSKKSLNDLGIVNATADDATKIAELGIHQSFYSSFDCTGKFLAGYPFYKQIEDLPEEDRNW